MIVSGASVAGAAHLDAGRGCEDAFRAVRTDHGVVLAVADGVGSRPRAALGAHLAVDTACRVLTAVPAPGPDADAGRWSAWTADRGARLAESCLRHARSLTGGEDAGELAAALLVALVRAPWVAFVSLGDCFAAVLTRTTGPDGRAERHERCHLVLPPPVPDGPPPAWTTSPAAPLRVRTFSLWEPELSGVVLATDGCAPLALDHPSARGLPAAAGPQPNPRFLPALAAALRRSGGAAAPLQALLAGPAAAERTGDDLTLLCALAEDGREWS
ncbi:protein phosphatase 2C domain-containing protein [Streptomyces zhihengii]|uniref:protein phosphatase 2C domain-containing protein n=1 Tax=Streptomyces zhihengii TaxID=1818004 RepID=UPI003686E6B3